MYENGTLITFEYTDEVERETILRENTDKYFVQESIVKEGNFLTFSTTKPVEWEIKDLKQENELNKQAIAELTLLLSMMMGGV